MLRLSVFNRKPSAKVRFVARSTARWDNPRKTDWHQFDWSFDAEQLRMIHTHASKLLAEDLRADEQSNEKHSFGLQTCGEIALDWSPPFVFHSKETAERGWLRRCRSHSTPVTVPCFRSLCRTFQFHCLQLEAIIQIAWTIQSDRWHSSLRASRTKKGASKTDCIRMSHSDSWNEQEPLPSFPPCPAANSTVEKTSEGRARCPPKKSPRFRR